MVFWEMVKKEILKQNTTQEWVAGKVGMDPGAFRAALSKKQEPRVLKALALADALNVTVEYLATGNDSSRHYEDMRLLALARRHRQALENLDRLDELTLATVNTQIEAVAGSSPGRGLGAAEGEAAYGET